jgi:hypothetical protein
MPPNLTCSVCNQVFNTASTLRSHRSRLGKSGKCRAQVEQKKASDIISQLRPEEIIEAVDKKQKNEKNEEALEDLKSMMNTLIEQNEYQKRQIIEQNAYQKRQNEEHNNKISELKDMMIDIQNNPRLLIVCNNLHPIQQLDLQQPQFQPVLEILNNELPEYANLGNIKTGKIHAKAINKLNHIQPTALKNGEDIYFKNAGAELRAATVGRGEYISKGYR